MKKFDLGSYFCLYSKSMLTLSASFSHVGTHLLIKHLKSPFYGCALSGTKMSHFLDICNILKSAKWRAASIERWQRVKMIRHDSVLAGYLFLMLSRHAMKNAITHLETIWYHNWWIQESSKCIVLKRAYTVIHLRITHALIC